MRQGPDLLVRPAPARRATHRLGSANLDRASRRPVAGERARVGVAQRSVVLLLVLGCVLSAVAARLVQVQVLDAPRYAQLGLDQRLRKVTLAAERGSMFDRNGALLAVSTPAQTVWADPRLVEDPSTHAAKLAPLLGVDEGVLLERLARRSSRFVYLARKVDGDVAAAVKALELPGVGLVPESSRRYPGGSSAGPVLGFVGTDNNGLGGLEYGQETALRGRVGKLVVERDVAGRAIPNATNHLEPALPGRDLVLTLDQSLQYAAESVLAGEVDASRSAAGIAIVMDVRTGDVLAMANVDGATADTPAGSAGAKARNRAVVDVYQPGSTNKVITMAGALEEGLVSPGTVLNVPDQLLVGDHVFRDNERHDPTDLTVADILAESSNVGTIKIGAMLGKERIQEYLLAFGLGRKTGLGFPGEEEGILLDPKRWVSTSMGTVPIGNGVAVTALQMLDVYATIANGGVWRQPRLIAATVDRSGERRDAPQGRTRRVVSARTAAQLTTMLEGVVSYGTGAMARVPGYTVAGKTGTARKPLAGGGGYSDAYIASFIGFAPAKDPRVAVAVILDDPGTAIYGGTVAAPAFARIMRAALRTLRVPPDAVAKDSQASAPTSLVAAPTSVPPLATWRSQTPATLPAGHPVSHT